MQDGELHNSYYLVRAGQSQAEAEGYVLTNPGEVGGLAAEARPALQLLHSLRQTPGLTLAHPSPHPPPPPPPPPPHPPTNPKTSTPSGLSDEGKRQVVAAYRQLRNLGLDSAAWVWPSITQNAYQSAEILGALLGVGRSRVSWWGVGNGACPIANGVGGTAGARCTRAPAASRHALHPICF